MEKTVDLEAKYQKLAAEYSKVRSQAAVLKKAVLDEQTKNLEMRELMKEQEQKLRKHSHEMESLTFRNDQLAKRISVLQQELQPNNHGKKGKGRPPENNIQSSFSVLDEELHKKILENAQLVSTMADRDFEVSNYKDKIEWLEDKTEQLQKQLSDNDNKYRKELDKLTRQKGVDTEIEHAKPKQHEDINKEGVNVGDKCSYPCSWKQETERWRTECEMLRAKPTTDKELSEYYETQITNALENEHLSKSEANSLWAENEALNTRLEQAVLDRAKLEASLEKSMEELLLTNQSYKAQLDAMTEHFAAQNEKITNQCDEIQVLRHRLNLKK